jgi:hypothetical protein
MDEKRKNSLDMEALEKNLPFYLWNDLQLLVEGKKNNDSCLDCIYCELESDFGAATRENTISGFQKRYLMKKYYENATEEELREWFEKQFKY